jgi:acylphosphatase
MQGFAQRFAQEQALRQEAEALRQEAEARAVYRRTYTLCHVNVALESFVLPNGVRQWIFEKAVGLGVMGKVQRIIHTNVSVMCEGTKAQLEQFDRQLRQLNTICEGIEITIPDTKLDNLTTTAFIISKNEHCSVSDPWRSHASIIADPCSICGPVAEPCPGH